MGSVFEEIRSEGAFCDAVLKVQDVEFQVHKIILSNIPYFQALFLRWSALDQRVYEVKYITPEVMGLVIEFAYTGSCTVTVDNVMEVMCAADQYNIMGMVEICRLFLEQQLCPDNCVGIWHSTSSFYCPELQSSAYRYILKHFDEVALSEELVDLTVEELADLLGRDDLIVRTETNAYEAMKRWVSHMPEQREGHLHQLMLKIRMCLVDLESLTNDMRSNDLVGNNVLCRPILRKISRLHRQRLSDLNNIRYSNYFLRPRLPGAILLATGGWSGGQPTGAIEAYDIRINRWVDVVPGAAQPRAYHGTAFLDGSVYFIGGYDGEEYFNSVCSFDPVRHVWRDVSPMNRMRCYVSVTTLDGHIYAMGGYTGLTRLRSAERYQPQTNKWAYIAPMNEERSDASCTTFQGMVYICGGFNGSMTLQSAEYYNPETDQWTIISPMRSRRSGLGVVACGNCIYAVGGNQGFQGDTRLRSVEAYDPQSNAWTDRTPMITTRSNFGIDVVEEHIFVVGGFDGIGTSSEVEKYDAALDEWTVAHNTGIPRSALNCCVVDGLPNTEEYTMSRDGLRDCQLEREEGVEEMDVELEEE